MSEIKNIGRRVSEVREQLDWSQEQLAEALGYSRNYISMVELGREPGKGFQRAWLTFEQTRGLVSNAELASPNEFSPRDRLRTALQAQQMTTAELARRIGYDGGVVANVVNGNGRMSEGMAEKIVEVLDHGLTVDDLLEGSDSAKIIDIGGVTGTVGAKPAFNLPGRGKTRYIPLLSWAAAGAMDTPLALDEGYTGEGVASSVPGRVFALEIEGDSMYPEISPGDYAVARYDEPPHQGQVVLVKTIHGQVWCKRYTTKEGGKFVVLSSVNNSYQPMEVRADEIAWIYPVKQVIRNY